MPRLTLLAQSLPSTVPFTGPEALERRAGQPFRARLGANESLFGPSPLALQAMARAAEDVWMYGDPENHDLKAAIAAHHHVSPENVVVGEGIDSLLGQLVRLLIGPGDHVVTSDGAYPTFNFHVAGFGGTLHKAPYRADKEDPQALLELAEKTNAKLIYLANPDNPMGSYHPGTAIAQMLDALPEGALLVLDEAYVDFAPDSAAANVTADDPRVIRFRTFSKAYGLAGLRLGYALAAPDLALAFDKVRNHFGIGRFAQAGGIAALADTGHLTRLRAWAEAGRHRLAMLASAHGLQPLPSATNFVAMDAGRDGAHAKALLEALASLGVFVRMPGVAPLNRCIRVSLGDAEAMDVFAEALPQALARLRR